MKIQKKHESPLVAAPYNAIADAEPEAAAAGHAALLQQISELEALQPVTVKDFEGRCAACELDDKAALTEIARLQVLMAILPKRTEARQNDLLESARKLSDMVGNFIHHTLGPRVRTLRAKAAEEVRKAIGKLVSDEGLLNRAVEQSDPVMALNSIYTTWNTSPLSGTIITEARRILASFETLLAYEKISASAIKQAGKIGYNEAFVQNMARQKKFLQELNESWTQTVRGQNQSA